MQTTAIAPQLIKPHQKITKVVDGDGLFVVDFFGKNETEIRLLGIDAPEVKRCNKLLQDERETHLPGQLLIKLGITSKLFLASVLEGKLNVSLILENKNSSDNFGRTLAYVLLKDGSCLSEIMVSEGYAKPYNKYYCSKLSLLQQLHFEAKRQKRGLFSQVNVF